MLIIQHDVPKQGFEGVTIRIAEILKANIEHQKLSQGLENNVDVYYERSVPYDKSEDIVVNVWCGNVNLDQHNQFEAQNNILFNIDTTIQGPENDSFDGDQVNSSLLKKITGWIRYILSNPLYVTLLYENGRVGGRYVQSIEFLDRTNNQEANGILMSRISYLVRYYEIDKEGEHPSYESLFTDIRIENTDKGYQLIINQ